MQKKSVGSGAVVDRIGARCAAGGVPVTGVQSAAGRMYRNPTSLQHFAARPGREKPRGKWIEMEGRTLHLCYNCGTRNVTKAGSAIGTRIRNSLFDNNFNYPTRSYRFLLDCSGPDHH